MVYEQRRIISIDVGYCQPKMEEKRKIARAASIVGGATMLSRIAGLVRDQVIAYFFGSSIVTAAFVVAFRIPNLFRRLLGEGALTVAFVPIFSRTLGLGGTPAASKLFRQCLTLLGLTLTILSILGVIFAAELVTIMAPGFLDDPAKFNLTVLLTQIMFPYIFFMAMGALFMGALNASGHFTTPALGPFVGNIAIILGAIFLCPLFDIPVLGLALGAMIGGGLQLSIQLPALRRHGLSLLPDFSFWTPEVKKILLLMGPAALGAAAYQISIFINTILASFLPEGSIPWLYFADRLMQFPLGVFTVAIGVATLPSLSRQAATGDTAGFISSARFALGLSFFVTVPAMVGLVALALPLVTILFERGEFTSISSQGTAEALMAYALGLPFLSGAGILARIFYSRANTRTPTLVATASLALGIIAALSLMGPLQHMGLALASSLGSIVNFFWLYALLLTQEKSFPNKEMLKELASYFLLAALMLPPVWYLGQWAMAADFFPEKALRTLGAVFSGIIIYLGLARLTRQAHLTFILSTMKDKFWHKLSKKV